MTLRVLVIEDHPANQQLMTYLLQAFGLETLVASDGLAGIETAVRERPDVIVCDLQLPLLDGFGVLRRLREDPVTRAIPVVAVTAFARADDRRRVEEAGFDGYLTKPIEPGSFVPSLLRIAESASAAPPLPRAQAATCSVLVVDDNRVNLQLARTVLEGCGCLVVTASSPADGLALAREARPDLILSDVVMGSASGFELLAAAKADPMLRQIPFVFVSSTRTSPSARREGLAMGAAKYLFRPIEPEVLLQELRPYLARPGAG